MADMEILFRMVNVLSPEERHKLLSYLAEDLPDMSVPPRKEFVFDLHPGAIWTSDDFDDPLPDEFWLGSDAE